MTRLFVVNPLSERVAKKGSVLDGLALDHDTDIFHLDPFEALPARVTKAADDGCTHIIIEGGDGTVQGVVSEFLRQAEAFEKFPAFSIVPGGMTNQIAKNIGLPSANTAAVKSKLRSSLHPTHVPLLNVSSAEGSQHSGFLLSTGAIPQITEYTKRKLHRKGVGGSLAVMGGILKGIRGDDTSLMKSTPVRIEGVFDGSHLGTVVTTLPSLILGLDPFWGRDDAPLRLTFVESDYKRLGRNILGIWAGRVELDRSRDGFHSVNRDVLNYEYSGPTVLDGEFLSFPSGKFTVRATRPVTFLR